MSPRNATSEQIDEALATARRRLIEARTTAGCWTGELSSSALATATAVTALAKVDADRHRTLIGAGVAWLAANANADGGWGDSTLSPSNVSATLLVRAAFSATGAATAHPRVVRGADRWLADRAGGLAPDRLARAVERRYGSDRTFSAPILAMAATCGLLGDSPDAWRRVAPLPFELAVLPRGLLRRVRLPVVSYALPALIAVGQVRHELRPSRNPVVRLLRRAAVGPTLRLLDRIQPPGGGFLEAAPLTAFVTMFLVAAERGGHPSVARGAEFLARSARADGSWPIDTNLSTWVTTLSVNALAGAGSDVLSPADRDATRRCLLECQLRTRHPYTAAEPGGWAWTDLPGGVPDADDTAGALLALRNLGPGDDGTRRAAARGATWLADLQNADGGVPTFCRGWGRLPFDRSGADLTAHAVAAWCAWRDDLPPDAARRVGLALRRAIACLRRVQRADGSFSPLWFGNPHTGDGDNPVYGTARVITGLAGAGPSAGPTVRAAAGFLLSARGNEGGWGAEAGAPPSIEETAVAVAALCDARDTLGAGAPAGLGAAVDRAAAWLIDRTDAGRRTPPAPIGLYFAKLGYFERLYPLIFTVGALGRVRAIRQRAGQI